MSADLQAVAPRRRPMGLGRGLSALLGDAAREPHEVAPPGDVRLVPVASIDANAAQPRRHFDEDALAELASSIAAHGLLQPIVVRAVGERYQIIAGERRWRAAQRVGLQHLPAVVRQFDDSVTLEVALIENIQREQLNALEEGEAYRRLIEEFGHSQDALARLLHKSRSHVANLMRLLDLPQSVRTLLAEKKLTMGHARALVGSPDAAALADQVVAKGLSVRATEALMQRSKSVRPKRGQTSGDADADIALLERQLSEVLQLKVSVTHGREGGQVTLAYHSLDQLDLICQRLSGERV